MGVPGRLTQTSTRSKFHSVIEGYSWLRFATPHLRILMVVASRSLQPRIYINGRFLYGGATGVHRFAYEVVRALDQLLEDLGNAKLRDRVELVTPLGVNVPVGLHNVRHTKGGIWGSGYAWEQFDLPRLSADGVLLSLCNLGPVAKRRQVVVLHDASTKAFPGAYSPAFRCAYGILLPAIVRRAAQLATVSEFSRDEISYWFGLPRSRPRSAMRARSTF